MSPTSLDDLDRHQRRRLLLRSALRILVTTVVLILLYARLPVASSTDTGVLVELVIGLFLAGVLLGRQVRQILRADHPELQAAEALALVIPVLVLVFAFTYVSLSHANPASFSQPMDKVAGVYFTVTVFSTVGFGDITATSQTARLVVTVQMLLDLVTLGLVVRAFVSTVQAARRQAADAQPGQDDG